MLHYGKSSGIISDNKLINLYLCCKYYYTIQGRNKRVQGGAIPRAPKSVWGRRMTAWGAENFQQCHKYCLQYSKFASIRPQIQMWGRQIWFLPRTPSNLVTPLVSCRSTPESQTALQGRNEGGKGHNSPGEESLWERRKSQQYHKCFLQCSAFVSERPQVPTWGRRSCFLSRAPYNLVTPLLHWSHTWNWFLALASFLNRASVIRFSLHSHFRCCFSFQSYHQPV